MDIFGWLLLSFMGLAVLVLFCFTIIWSNNTLWCYFMYPSEWKQWKYYLSKVDEFKFGGANCEDFYFEFEDGVYAWCWKSELDRKGRPLPRRCSIHKGKKCILCSYNAKMSKLMAKKLMSKVANES